MPLSHSAIHDYLESRTPIADLPVDWEQTGYTSDEFNRWAASLEFPGWDGDIATEEEVQVITAILNAEPGDYLLDVACGYGRHALPLAEGYGLLVTGTDISDGLITNARRRAVRRGIDIEYEVGDARDIPWVDQFQHAMVAFNSFSLFSPQDAPLVLGRIRRALRRNGRLFMDLDNKSYSVNQVTHRKNWSLSPQGLTLQEIYLHEKRSVEVLRDLHFPAREDRVREFLAFKQLYSIEELTSLLLKCGFKAEQVYGGWDLTPLSRLRPKILLVATRQD
ncbi:MAG: class I SAM-dependent methyltransferase [SAR202 cluster bacterium]|nr:class I SAM-dependent methyltransferase [SAR202 cluster bacterium]